MYVSMALSEEGKPCKMVLCMSGHRLVGADSRG
jgi:hypothetical protein